MASNSVQVVVQIRGEDVLAGQLWFHRRGKVQSATFAYDASYLTAGGYQLDPSLPLISSPQQTAAGRALFGAFSDCAPDRWGRTLFDRAERARARDEARRPRTAGEADYLLGVRDDLRQGALRFRSAVGSPFLASESSAAPLLIDLPRLLAASERLDRDEALEDDVRMLLRDGSSLGGARPKAHVRDGEQVAIAKFPSPRHDEWDVAVWEAVAMTLAAQAGITVPAHRLERVAGKPVLIVSRFDRAGAVRIGYVSAMTMLAAGDGTQGDYLDIAEAIARDGDGPTRDLQELWRRLAFSRLINNTDDHLRNHGFLRRSEAGWSLAPAFDVNPNPNSDLFSTTLAGADTFEDVAELVELAPDFRLTETDARVALADIGEALGHWRGVAARYGAGSQDITLMEPVFELAATQARDLPSRRR